MALKMNPFGPSFPANPENRDQGHYDVKPSGPRHERATDGVVSTPGGSIRTLQRSVRNDLRIGRKGRVDLDAAQQIEREVERLVVLRIRRDIGL